MLNPKEGSGGKAINRRVFIKTLRCGGLLAVGSAALWRATSMYANRIKILQNAYDQGQITRVSVVQKIVGDHARGCIVANANGSRLHALQLRDFNFLHQLRTHQDIIAGHHGPDPTPPKIGTILIPERRGSGAILEDENGRRVICTNEHVAAIMPNPDAWKKDKQTDLAIIGLEHANHITSKGQDSVPYTLHDFTKDQEAIGQRCVVEAYATNALVEVKGILLGIQNLGVQGDMGMLVINSPIPASKYRGMSGSVMRHEGKPIASVHAGAAVLQKGDQLLEVLSNRDDPRSDECTTVLLSLSGPERMKKILS